jgi:hypothetical protein
MRTAPAVRPAAVRAAAVRTAVASVLAVGFGLAVVVEAGDTRSALLVLAGCLATLAVPVAIRVWGGRAADADALFVRVLVALSAYLLPMALFQALFGP